MKKRVGEFFSRSGPYKAEMDAYDKQYFEEHPEQDVAFPVDPEAAYSAKPLPTGDLETLPMPSGNDELDTVNRATTLDEAFREYTSRYSFEAVDAGTQSPQLAAEMLLGIYDKFNEKMSSRQKRGVALETIRMGEAIISLADKPKKKSKEWTNIKGVMELSDIITLAQTYAPEKVETLTEGLRHVASKVESRSPAISGPIFTALDTFNSLPEDERQPFDNILEQVERADLNESDRRYMEKQAKLEKERAEREAAADKEREQRIAAAEEELARRKERMLQELADAAMEWDSLPATGLTNTADASVAMSLEDLEAADDRDDSKLIGVK